MRFWVWSFPGASGRSRSLPHVSGHSSCGDMTISELRNRLRYVKHGGVPLPLPRSSVRPGIRGGAVSGGVRGDLRVTVRASPRGVPHPSSAPQPVGLPLEWAGTSPERGTPPVSFGAPPDNQMSIAASEGELSLSGDYNPAALPPLGVVALSEPAFHQAASWSRLQMGGLRGRLLGKDVLVRTDNTATIAYINRQGGLRSCRMSQLARHHLLWNQKHLRSLHAIHIPGVFNRAADELSRAALPGEWRLHPPAVQLIWRQFGVAQVNLFASPETTHC